MRSKFFVTLFTACLVTLSSVQVLGREYFSGFVNKKLKNLLQCNFVAYYNLRDNGPDPNSFLDFIGEPEQFYWFIEHYLSVPFSIPKNLKDKKEHNLSSCANRSWVSEFLRSYEEPDIKELMKYLDKEQKVYFSYTFENIEPVPKYTSFALKEFHKYCILPPLVETSIKQKDQDGMLSFQLNQDEYKIYLSSIGSPISALKKLYQSMEDGERKNSLKNILDNERSNDVFINCPVYNLKLHYHKECDSQPNVLKCLDSYIKKLCERRIAGKEKGTFCDHLLFLFDALKSPYIDNFKKFLTRDDVHLVKPQSVWTLPLFTTYNPRDIKNPNSNIPVDIFKVLNSKNKMFLSFFDQAPKSPYYMEESQGLVKLSDFASSIFDKLHRFFYAFKKKGNQISPVSVKELSHNISDFSFKRETGHIECKKVKKSLNLDQEVEVVKGVAAQKICKIIEHLILKKGNKEKSGKKEIDDIYKGFRMQCILIATHVEAFNIIRQLLNMESMLSLTRYTSLYLHKFFKSVTTLKGNFLYENPSAIKHARACGRAVLHVPAVLYRRNIYLAETFLSLYLGISNLVSSNPSSPFFEYAVIEFLVYYFNKDPEKYLLYLFSIVSVLYINMYYYEQLFCHHKEQFELLRSKMIHPNIADRILENIKSLMKNPRYTKMRSFYLKFENDNLFDKRKVFEVLYTFDEFLSNTDAQQKVKMQEEVSDESFDLDSSNDGIGFRKEDIFFESEQGSMDSIDELDESLEGVDSNQQKKAAEYLKLVPDEEKAQLVDRNKELELELYKYIGTPKQTNIGVGTVSSHSPPSSPQMEHNTGAGKAVRPAQKGINQKLGEMGKRLKRMKGKEGSKLRKGVDFYESNMSLNQQPPGESAPEEKGSSSSLSSKGTS
ncbi:high molecular weight rhoptry protein 3, putative [Plasmodium knowlesi strain H]|uniref:High molecular weight rhoptry protein 3, putative n=3 Tax=Plasmodium knowlesi TaxID=5850 RepID=B3L364_PLAKH|nr:high molecular weight rhoptry protein 3, putative [Plasmodium knowlesi strain H]OTN67333.1 putative High molecular weight rhoptry protein 3 [Plasmodium knowlesi]CAA9987321.1 high molecular weight rhoptry protein 3, putative [Plasmodium knowlesi strain H]SBO24650.1 high molecular weight rhoptry protein 3, putative [Plasmodium knowlesi strain H]VVS76795.1 high molecular weight rhoptry protein 3, putative [Plasmodium knowlesi strain H]|eukprot:XP_002258325.1 rhoptry protein, putative [Plasmodium knowlesi strain H]